MDFNEIESKNDYIVVLNAIRLIMQYEHTNAEELQEITGQEAIDMAEKEENWEIEREILKVFIIIFNLTKILNFRKK